MAVTHRTLRLMRMIRIDLDRLVDTATADLVKAWARAWDELVWEWSDAVDEILAIVSDQGRWPTRAQLLRAEHAMKALDLTRDALTRLSDTAGVRISGDLPAAVALADAHIDVIASQYPADTPDLLLAVTFGRPSAEQLAAVVARTTERVTSMLRPLSGEATDALYRTLIRGVATGTNPRQAARTLIRRLEGGFNGGLTRAMTVCRTEMLDAHRAAAAEQHDANSDVLAGWQWSATLDVRTCPACLTMNGAVFSLIEPGPQGHQQCRCARLPVLRPWSELGLGADEPESVFPDSRSWFDALPLTQQRSIMGPARLALLRSCAVSWADLATLRRTRGWRDSWAVTPVKTLAQRGAA